MKGAKGMIANRMDWVDWAKTIAITLVVFGHLRSDFMSYIFSFHMPFFLMLSGFLQKRRPLREELVKSAKSLLAPYVIYNLYLLVYSIFTGEYTPDYPWSMAVGLQWNLSMACRPLWFLLALFWMRIAYVALPRWGNYVLALGCGLFTWCFSGGEFMTPTHNFFQVFASVICFPFFVIGASLKEYKGYQLPFKNAFLCYAVILVQIVLGLYIAHLNGFVNIFRCRPGDCVPLFYLAATLVSIGLIQLIYKILNHSNNYVQLISEGTLLIFALHQSIFWPLREFMPKGNLWTLGIALMAIVILSGLAWLSRRYCPVFIGKWK